MRNSGREGHISRTACATILIFKYGRKRIIHYIFGWLGNMPFLQKFLKEIPPDIEGWISERIFEQGCCWWKWVLTDPLTEEVSKPLTEGQKTLTAMSAAP